MKKQFLLLIILSFALTNLFSQNPVSADSGDTDLPAVLPPPPTPESTPTSNPVVSSEISTDTASQDTAPAGFATTLDSLLGIPDRFNFFIADNPAFNLLDVSPSKVLRPSTPQDISIQLSEFWSGNSLIIPNSFGMQVSPAMILQSQMKKPSDWAKCWQPLSIGIAASRPDSNTNFNEFIGDFSVGFQYTLIDQAGEHHFEKHLRRELFAQEDSLKPQLEAAFVDSVQGFDSTLTSARIKSSMKRQMDAYVHQKSRAKALASYASQIASYKKQWKESSWAGRRFSIGGGASWNTSDQTSLVFQSDVLGAGTMTADTLLTFPGFSQFAKYASYATFSVPIPRKNPALKASEKGSSKSTSSKSSTPHRQWGKWLIGVTYGGTQLMDTNSVFTGIDTLTFDSTFQLNLSKGPLVQNFGITNRLYLGSNRAKVYVEGQLFWDSRTSDQLYYLADMGLEIGILDGIWVQLYAGVTNLGRETFVHPDLEQSTSPTTSFNSSKPQFIANFDLRFSLPESFYGYD